MMFAVEGKNGLLEDASRVASNRVSTVDRVHARTEAPIETGDKYVTQEGFLWSNGVYVWLVRDVLGERLITLDR